MSRVRIKTRFRDANTVYYSVQYKVFFFFWREHDVYNSEDQARRVAQRISGEIDAYKKFKSEVIRY